MIGTMGLKGLEVSCVVGIYPHERDANQPLAIDVELDYDFGATESEAIGDAVDYDQVVAALAEVAERGKFQLIERMAEEMVRTLLIRFGKVTVVRLEIRKSRAVPRAQCSFVRLERKRA
jgi:dihydroneopterin aldolase